jgi:hypothetical protein
VSSVGTPEPREALAESWTPRPRMARVESLAPCRVQPKVSATRSTSEVNEARDEEAAKGQAVKPPGVAVRPLTTILRVI